MAAVMRHSGEAARSAQPGAILLVIRKPPFRYPQSQAARPNIGPFTSTNVRDVSDEFIARSPDELSLAKGDRLELIERDDDFGDGWFLGRHLQNGNTGLFPEVYTTSAPQGTLSAQSNRYNAAKRIVPGASASVGAESSEKRSGGIVSSQQLAASPDPSSYGGQISQGSPRIASSQDASNPETVYTGKYNPVANVVPSVSASPTTMSAPAQLGPKAQSSGTSNTVMNETLSVINEHITDMRQTGRGSSPNNRLHRIDSPSEYSASASETRLSYIQGSETEEEESGMHTENEVKDWTPARVAEYLEDAGVEKRHCEVFREQEFSGDVILGMDQSSIFLKELDLGPIGRRLKTWQKIRALQDEVLPPKPSQTRKVSEHSQSSSRRASQGSLSMIQRASQQLPERPGPQGPDAVERLGNQLQAHAQSGRPEGGSTLSMISTSARPNPHNSRPSAASVRSLGHSRRHSSIDQALRTPAGSSPLPMQTVHSKKPSLDQGWNMAVATNQGNDTVPASSSVLQASNDVKATNSPQANNTMASKPSPRPQSTVVHTHAASSDRTAFEKRTSQLNLETNINTTMEADRGYVSSTEVGGGRKERRVLRKRDGSEHNRASSYESGKRLSFFRRASRAASPARSRDISAPVSVVLPELAAIAQENNEAASITASEQSGTPIVTNLEQDSTTVSKEKGVNAAANNSSEASSSPRKGMRATSDAVTGREKAVHSMWAENVSPTETSTPHSPSSGTPSGASRSIELDDANKSQYATPVGIPPSSGTKRKSKKKTSAYLRGLEHKSPQEQVVGCEHSGWMKKKSSNLMTNWKPRLFVLRGRRLSYYYSENDTEEKGLIDISGHRVLPADNERLTGLHASITKATSSPTSPEQTKSSIFSSTPSASPVTPGQVDGGTETAVSTPSTMAGSSIPNTPKEGASGQRFIFKLVPPRVGMSKAVNFTKPTVHYFAVPSIEVGRLWMAALMKATIDRDESVEVVTTYQQKTVSLAKARARKERPPALKGLEEEEGDAQTLAGTTEADSQLQKVDEDDDAENEEEDAQSLATTAKTEPEPPMDQMREVTDLSPVVSRTSMSSSQHQRQRSGSKRSGSGEGLGIQGLSNGGTGFPLLNQIKS